MFSAGVLLLSGALLAWLRMSMNYGSKPIFKSEEMRAAFHPDSFVQQVLLMHVPLCALLNQLRYTVKLLFLVG